MSSNTTQPKGWRETTLGEVAEKIGDGLHGTPKYSDNGKFFFVNGSNIKNGKIFIKPDSKKVNEEEFLKYDKELTDSTILLSINGTIGNLAKYRNERCILGKSAAYINVKEGTSVEFIYYLMLDNKSQYNLSKNANGSTIKNVSLAQLRTFQILLPPLPEQKAIAEVLSSLDDKIDLLQRQNNTLEDMAETLFRQWFVEPCKNGLPQGWREKPLDEIANYLNGLACQKYPPKNETDRLPVLKIKELKNGIDGNSDWVTSAVGNKYIIECGDVIFSWSGSLVIKPWEGSKCVLNQHLFKVTSNQYPRWYIYFWTKYHIKRFTQIADSKATTMGHIKRKDLSDSIALLPPSKEIAKMNEVITPIFEKMILNFKHLRTLAKLRDTLLPKLMSGRVRVAV